MATYEWAPDYSQFIDRERFPDAIWYQGAPGGSDTVSINAGFYRPASRSEREDQVSGLTTFWPDQRGAQSFIPVGMWEAPGGFDQDYRAQADNKPTYQRLKEAGLWDLSSPDSPTWKYLNSQAGGRDVQNDPSALFDALLGARVHTSPFIGGNTGNPATSAQNRPIFENSLREALSGAPQSFVDQFVPAAGKLQENYWTSIDDSVTFRDAIWDPLREMISVPPIAAALGAITGGATLAATGSGAAAGAAGGAVAGGASGAAGDDWFRSALTGAATGAAGAGLAGALGSTPGSGLDLAALGDSLGGFTTNPSLADLGGMIDPTTGFPVNDGTMPPAVPPIPAAGTTPTDLASQAPLPNVAVPAQQPIQTIDLTDASAGGTVAPAMPPAVPPTDPTFGGTLTQTGAGQFENLANTGAFGAGLGATAATTFGGDVAPTAGTPSAPPASSGSALSRLLDGTATTQDWLSVLGNVGATGLSMVGLNRQQDSMNAIAQQQMAAEQARYADLVSREQARFGTLMGREDAAIGRQRADIDFGRAQGAPYRDQLAGLMADPNSFLTSQAVQAPVQQGTDALARSLSVKGNPAGSPAAMAEIQKYASNSLASLLGQEKDRLATFGGLSAFNQAGATVPGIGSSLPGSATAGSNVGTQGGLAALMGGAQAGAQRWGNLGTGIRDLFSLV